MKHCSIRGGRMFPAGECARAMVSVSAVLFGLATQGLEAQEPVHLDKDATTVQLLRGPEWRFDGDCGAFLQKAERLERGLPSMMDAIQRTRAMLEAAKQESKEAFDKAKKTLMEKAKEKALAMALDKAKSIARSKDLLKARIKLMQETGVLKADRKGWLEAVKTLDDLEKAVDTLNGQLEKVVTAGNQAAEFRLATLGPAQDSCKTVWQLADQLNRQFVDSGLAESLGSNVAAIGGPAFEIGFEMGNLLILAGVDALDGAIISQRDIPVYEKNLESMENSLQRIQAQIAEARATYDDCLKEQAMRKEYEQQKLAMTQKPVSPGKTPSVSSPKVATAPESTHVFVNRVLPLTLLAGASALALSGAVSGSTSSSGNGNGSSACSQWYQGFRGCGSSSGGASVVGAPIPINCDCYSGTKDSGTRDTVTMPGTTLKMCMCY